MIVVAHVSTEHRALLRLALMEDGPHVGVGVRLQHTSRHILATLGMRGDSSIYPKRAPQNMEPVQMQVAVVRKPGLIVTVHWLGLIISKQDRQLHVNLENYLLT